jgi:hypothetical protein
MEQSIKSKLIRSFGKVYESAKGCKLEPDFFEKVQAEITVISDYFGLTDMQSLLVAIA